MAIDWYRGGPDFQAAQITTGRDLAAMGQLGGAAGEGVRALQRAVQNEKKLKAEEAEIQAQLDGGLGGGAEQPVPEPADPLAGLSEPGLGGDPTLTPTEGIDAPEMEGGGFMGALSRMGGGLRRGAGALGRMAVGLPMEPGLTERVGQIRGQLAAEQEANKAHIARMEALSRIGGRNPEMLGAIHRAMPESFPEFPDVAQEAEMPGNPSEYAADMAWETARALRGPDARPTPQEMESAMDAVRKKFATPVQEYYETIEPVIGPDGRPVIDPTTGAALTRKVRQAGRPPAPPSPEPIPDASSAGVDFYDR